MVGPLWPIIHLQPFSIFQTFPQSTTIIWTGFNIHVISIVMQRHLEGYLHHQALIGSSQAQSDFWGDELRFVLIHRMIIAAQFWESYLWPFTSVRILCFQCWKTDSRGNCFIVHSSRLSPSFKTKTCQKRIRSRSCSLAFFWEPGELLKERCEIHTMALRDTLLSQTAFKNHERVSRLFNMKWLLEYDTFIK